jgi:hypothetical protein
MTTLNLASALDFVTRKSREHDAVVSAEPVDDFTLQVTRREHEDVTVAAITETWLSDGDVKRLISRYPDIDGIVNSGKGAHYSGEAKREARQQKKALHTFGEYMSALGREAFTEHEDSLVAYALKAFEMHRKVTDVEQICEKRIRLLRGTSNRSSSFRLTSIPWEWRS